MAKILLIEPDQNMSQVYTSALKRAGHVITTAKSAQAAIRALDEAGMVDAIILEPQLVGHNGIEFLYELRSYVEWQGIPVILLTNLNALIMQNTILTEKIGIAAYLYKPVTTNDILSGAVAQAVVANIQ